MATTTQLVKSTPLVCHGHTRPVPAIHFSSPDQPVREGADPTYVLISACKDGKPMLRDWVGDWQGTFTDPNVGHKGAVWDARVTRDGTLAATASADFSAKLWDATTGRCLLTLPHEHMVRTIDFAHDSSATRDVTHTRVLTGGHDKVARIWDLAKRRPSSPSPSPFDGQDVGPEVVNELREQGGGTTHAGVVKKVLWDEPRRCCITMGEDKLIKWWDLDSLEKVHEMSMPNDDAITSMERSHDGSILALTHGHSVTFLSLESRTPVKTHTLNYAPSSVSLHPSFRIDSTSNNSNSDATTTMIFVTGSTTDEWVRVHAYETGLELEVGKGHHGPVHQVAFSPDGELYASGSEDGTVRLWQTSPKNYGLWRINDGGS